MKAKVKIKHYSELTIDLEEYGHESNVRFEDLTENEQHEITDILLDEIVPEIIVKTLSH